MDLADLVTSILLLLRHHFAHYGPWARVAIRWVSMHTGAPALLVAAVLVVVGFKLLKRSARFALEVALVTGVLVLASELGWIRW